MSVDNLTNEKLKEYEKVLLNEKEGCLKLIQQLEDLQKMGQRESSGDLSGYTLHQADQGTDNHEKEKQVYLLDTELEKLKSLNQALKRVYDRTYGICEICGNYIQEARLKIIPYARFCIDCKHKDEKKKKK